MARTKDHDHVDLELRRPWHGADGLQLKVCEANVWRLYHLVAGGISTMSQLARYSGISRVKLDGIDINRLWLSADNTWHRVRDRIVAVALPAGLRVRCRRCNLISDKVPCCNGCGQDFALIRDENGGL